MYVILDFPVFRSIYVRLGGPTGGCGAGPVQTGTRRNERQRSETVRSGHQRSGAVTSGDRKSVVEGKSVSGRVDLGGRRIIIKKKNTPQRHTDKKDTRQTVK